MPDAGSPVSAADRQADLVIVIPVYNDWESLGILLGQLDQQLAAAGIIANVLVVDDGSTSPRPQRLVTAALRALRSVHVLVLRRNVGHQRAIALALVHVHAISTAHSIVVMDADGQDRAEDVPGLLAAAADRPIVFAERGRRLESTVFQTGYHLYRALHWLFTGIRVRFGNFSVITRDVVGRLVVSPELWNHYAAAVLRCRIPYTSIPLPRGRRIAGHSRMNYVSLVMHGISAISVFADIVAARVLAAAFILLVVDVAAIGVVIGIRLFTTAAIPGWATYSAGLLTLALLQLLSISFLITFLLLNLRSHAMFIPSRDGAALIDRVDGPLE